jgi:ketosteroid isomerase-like protein
MIFFILIIIFISCEQKNKLLEKPNEKRGIVTADTSIILAYEQKLIEAYKDTSVETIAELYHDDLIFNSPNGQVLSKTDDIESMRSGMLKIQEYSPSNYIVRLIGDVATLSVSIHIKAKIADDEFEGNFRFLRIWKQQGTKWKVVAISGYQTK